MNFIYILRTNIFGLKRQKLKITDFNLKFLEYNILLLLNFFKVNFIYYTFFLCFIKLYYFIH